MFAIYVPNYFLSELIYTNHFFVASIQYKNIILLRYIIVYLYTYRFGFRDGEKRKHWTHAVSWRLNFNFSFFISTILLFQMWKRQLRYRYYKLQHTNNTIRWVDRVTPTWFRHWWCFWFIVSHHYIINALFFFFTQNIFCIHFKKL